MKCINCYREIDEHLKFCTYCGAKQPLDRAAYEREHPELANALSEEEQQELERQRQIEEAERQRQEAERLAQEEAERKAREEALAQSQVAQQYPKYQEGSLGNQPPSSSGYDRGYNPNYEQQHFIPWNDAALSAKKHFQDSNDLNGFREWLSNNRNAF